MWFDELDKKIREAAERHQPSYNEDAWTKMEHKLNQHLPQKEGKRKRYFIWFLLFMLTGSAVLYTIKWNNQSEETIHSDITPNNRLEYKTPVPPTTSTELLNEENKTSFKIEEGASFPYKKSVAVLTHSRIQENANKKYGSTLNPNQKSFGALFDPYFSSMQQPANKMQKQIAVTLLENSAWKLPGNLDRSFNEASLWNQTYDPSSIQGQTPGFRRSLRNNLSVALYGGPSLSSVKLNMPGKLTPSYGAALRYALNSNFTVSAGFFINDKIYPASKHDYHPPAGYWTNYTDLLKIDAACKVYELPVNISYTIHKKNNHEWLATAGVSSYFMKNETYNYKYRNTSGQIMYRGWTLENGSNHHFAVLNLSAGYKYHLNAQTAISIEPNLKLPLKGVGFGKIKFYDAGTMIGLHIKPFAKK